ncbi:glycosyltransferase [Arthrobacter sulfonylureivorans]|uniref:glycosyltransferase n=1 Tax=Arthrobacter sulfonylureivorans TaxID=2486855 RepID=UPI0039E4B257
MRIEYVLPLKWRDSGGDAELTAYLESLPEWADLTVVDGSPDPVFAQHHLLWRQRGQHLRPDGPSTSNGKVQGVLTGLRHSRHELVIIADDDVRYTPESLASVAGLLVQADLVRPQNFFDPLPWHARWDTARSLLNRAFASDYPGTMAVRRSVLLQTQGYRGDVLFENLELIRTVQAAGGRQIRADGVYVRRLPPTLRHFVGPRVRQAYDSQTQPARLAVELLLLPLMVVLVRRPAACAALAAAAVVMAEAGRRRAGGEQVFSMWAAWWAPLWLLERAVTSWIALAWRCAGGMPYGGRRLRTAASSPAALRRQYGHLNRGELYDEQGSDRDRGLPRRAAAGARRL